MKIIFIIIAIVVLPILAWITYRLADSTEDTTVRRVQAQTNYIADLPNDSPEAMHLLSEKKGTSIADALVDAGFIRSDGLIDRWGEKLIVKCANEKCTQIIVRSNGPNRQNDNGKVDDIVSTSRAQ